MSVKKAAGNVCNVKLLRNTHVRAVVLAIQHDYRYSDAIAIHLALPAIILTPLGIACHYSDTIATHLALSTTHRCHTTCHISNITCHTPPGLRSFPMTT